MGKYGPFKRKKDWVGKTVMLRSSVETQGGHRIRAGTTFTVTKTGPSRWGYRLQRPECGHCGHAGCVKVEDCSSFALVDERNRPLTVAEQLEKAKELLRQCEPFVRESARKEAPGESERLKFERYKKFYRLLEEMDAITGGPK